MQLPTSFPLREGGTLRGGQLAFECFGRAKGPVVIVQGGISAGRHVAARDGRAGWWSGIVGPGRAIDTRRYRVLAFDFLGGAGASSGPADCPTVTSEDQARATLHALDELGIDRVHAFVGASYGGMVGLALAAIAPARVQRLVVFGAPARAHPLATAWRCLQRDAVRLGRAAGREAAGLELARALAMTTYRGADELAERFTAPPRVVGRALSLRGRGLPRRARARLRAHVRRRGLPHALPGDRPAQRQPRACRRSDDAPRRAQRPPRAALAARAAGA